MGEAGSRGAAAARRLRFSESGAGSAVAPVMAAWPAAKPLGFVGGGEALGLRVLEAGGWGGEEAGLGDVVGGEDVAVKSSRWDCFGWARVVGGMVVCDVGYVGCVCVMCNGR